MNRLIMLFGTATILFITVSQAMPKFLLTEDSVKPGINAATLVVLLHGYTLTGESLKHVQNTLGQINELEGFDLLRPNIPLDTFSLAPSSRITAELIFAIDRAWQERAMKGNRYKRIAMVGRSAGGLYARKIYAAACGENTEAPFEQDLKDDLESFHTASLKDARPWAAAVDRIVLLAGMNRGWSISHHMSISRAVMMKLGVKYAFSF